jgi:hypothetical protein
MFRSTCFGLLHTHHQELTSVLTASGFTLERGGSSVVSRNLAHKITKTTICFVLSVRPFARLSVHPSARNNSTPTGRMFINFYMYFSKMFRENLSFINLLAPEFYI